MVLLLYKVPLASLIVAIDTNVWLITIVTMAGPMLLSGIYEAVLDIRTLTFVRNRSRWNSMTVRSWAHLLLAALLGNLDLNPAWDHATAAVFNLPSDDLVLTSCCGSPTDTTNESTAVSSFDHAAGKNTEATKADPIVTLSVSTSREIQSATLGVQTQPPLLQINGI
jgi:hypothetical protein